jgi:GNAT superfamily N-acetyltransferase
MATQALKQEQITLPFAPDIPGLIFRGFQGESDYSKMLALINASKVVDQIERSDTLEEVVRNYEHLNNCDPYRDMIFAEVNGEPIAYGRVEWNISDDNEWLGFILAFMHPDWRRKGIGTAMLRYQEDHLRQILKDLLSEGVITEDTSRYFENFASDTEIGKEALLHKEGYSPVRYFYSMVRPFSDPMVLNYLNEEENKEYNRKRGWTENISVRRPWRRCGLARALLTHSLQMFKDMGMDHAALGVDTQNLSGALDLYQSVGFRVEKRQTAYRKKL